MRGGLRWPHCGRRCDRLCTRLADPRRKSDGRDQIAGAAPHTRTVDVPQRERAAKAHHQRRHPLPDHLRIQFAIGTGLRQGEHWNLEISDVILDGDGPHVVVRFGSKGKPPKNGKIRRASRVACAGTICVTPARRHSSPAGGVAAWRLEEVREMLGHTSIKVTERYAHFAPGALRNVATATRPTVHGHSGRSI